MATRRGRAEPGMERRGGGEFPAAAREEAGAGAQRLGGRRGIRLIQRSSDQFAGAPAPEPPEV